MRFECSVHHALSTEGKGSTTLEEEIKAEDAGNSLFLKTHETGEIFCILNDVVVVSKCFAILY